MTLSDLNLMQLERVYERLHPGGCWDWPTLRLTYPARALLMRSVLAEIDRQTWDD